MADERKEYAELYNLGEGKLPDPEKLETNGTSTGEVIGALELAFHLGFDEVGKFNEKNPHYLAYIKMMEGRKQPLDEKQVHQWTLDTVKERALTACDPESRRAYQETAKYAQAYMQRKLGSGTQ